MPTSNGKVWLIFSHSHSWCIRTSKYPARQNIIVDIVPTVPSTKNQINETFITRNTAWRCLPRSSVSRNIDIAANSISFVSKNEKLIGKLCHPF